jgi:hypothetical protein
MSQDAAHSTALPASPIPEPAKLPLTFSIVMGIAGLFVFLATQIGIVAGAAIWAIGGYFHFGRTGFAILVSALAPVALYLCRKILVMAVEAERDPANN